jgi:anaphase-promoting complex subunit 10
MSASFDELDEDPAITSGTAQQSGSDSADDDEPDEASETQGDGVNASLPNAGTSTSIPQLDIVAVPDLDRLFGLREIGREALCWQLSSAKPGNGVEQIRDKSVATYWQSDGTAQPHWIQVHFGRRVAISHVCLYLDFSLDESYTPKRITIEAGMTTQDLSFATYPVNTSIEVHEPVGWCVIPLSSPPDPLDDDADDEDDDDMDEDTGDYSSLARQLDPYNSRKLVRAHLIRISIISMHQNGRDTHVRQVQLYGPRTSAAAAQANMNAPHLSRYKAGSVSLSPKRESMDGLDLGPLSLNPLSTIR